MEQVRNLINGIDPDKPLKGYVVFDGKCSDPDWPDNLKPHLKIFHFHVYTDAEIEEYHKRNNLTS